MSNDTLIYGEQVADLLPGLFEVKKSIRLAPNGNYRISARIERDNAVPLRRALMRVKADLLREDADRVGRADEVERRSEELSHDALIRLIEAVATR